MKCIKYLVSIVLVFYLTLIINGTGAYAYMPVTQTEIIKMTGETLGKASYNNVNVFSLTDEVTFATASSALEIDFSGYEGSDANINFNFSNFANVPAKGSSYDTVKLRLYANETGGRLNIVAMTDVSATSAFSYARYTLQADTAGQWYEATVKLSDFTVVTGQNGPFSWDALWGIRINIGGMGTAVQDTTKFYIDEIYLEKPLATAMDAADGYIVKEFNNPSRISNIPNLIVDTNIKRLYDVSAKFTIGTSDMRFNVYPENTIDVEGAGYRYLNQWVYSPEAVEGGNFTALVYASSDLQSDRIYYRYTIPVNWSGWKLISIDLSTGIGTNPGSFSWSDVRWVAYNVNGFSLTPVVDYLNFDKVWFSVDKPQDYPFTVSTTPDSGAGNVSVLANVTLSFSNPVAWLREGAVTIEKGEPSVQLDTNAYAIEAAPFDPSKLILSFADRLNYQTSYTVTLGSNVFDVHGQNLEETDITFTTEAQPDDTFDFSTLVFTDKSGDVTSMDQVCESLSVSTTVTSSYTGEKPVVLILALYSADGALVACNTSETKSVSGGETAGLEATVEAEDFGGHYAKAFVWDSIDSLKPFTSVVFE